MSGGVGARAGTGLFGLALGSIGVVYGDIGTSPLYALREAVVAASGPERAELTRVIVLGVVSLILWALIVVVTLKYVLLLLRADNNGEGGTLTLMALASRAVGRVGKAAATVALLGIISAALFYGDAVITPALSVLSAIEGIDVAVPAFHEFVVPLTVVVLLLLFAFQSRGTAKVAALFGPIMSIWFVAIALPGLVWVGSDPGVLWALNPLYGVDFLMHHGIIGLFTLGAVFLAVTGAEALYADLGHFGRPPIQLAWFCLVLPALAINYLGQGALVYAHPEAVTNPFFLLYPGWARGPMVILATVATVIASQAVITGAYSLTSQAIQLGLLPRFEIRHTSAQQAGQIYMPRVNGLLLVGVLLLVALFRSSSALASAYGIAVTGTMVVTGMMAFVVIWRIWQWSVLAAAALILPFLVIDLTFLSANMLKVIEGGWVPLALGGVIMLVMYTWRRGSRLLFDKTRRLETPLDDLVACLSANRRNACRERRYFSPAIRKARRPRCCTASSTIACCTRRTSFSPSRPPTRRASSSQSACISNQSARLSCACCCASAIWKRRTSRRRLASRASSGCNSTSCRRRFSCRAAPCGRRRVRACRAGRTVCSSRWRAPPTTPPTISRYRPTAWSRLARRSPSEALEKQSADFSNAHGARRRCYLIPRAADENLRPASRS